MEAIIAFIREYEIGVIVLKLVLAMILGGTIGLERGKQGRAAGMRTHIFVCLGSALATMIGFYAADIMIAEYGTYGDPLRVAAQVVSGIGFLGVGTILIKGRFQITGLTTAAGLWCAAAIGIALGAGFFVGAIVTFICSVITMTLAGRFELMLNKKYSRFGIYVEIASDKYVRAAIDLIEEKYHVTDIQVTAPRSGTAGNVGIEANVHNRDFATTPTDVSKTLEAEEYVIFALESI